MPRIPRRPQQSQRTKDLIRRQREIMREIKRRGQCPLTTYVHARRSGIHGCGVFATGRIPRGTKLIEYVGEKISKAEADRRHESGKSVYIFTLNARVDIDGSVGGNGAHLINHSCDPNARSELGDNQVWIIARRTIFPGEEITYDYGFDEQDYEAYPCACGAASCRGYMISPEAWKRLTRRGALKQ